MTTTKIIANFSSKEREMNFAWHRKGFFLIGRSIWKKIGLEYKSAILVKFDERNCCNSTFRWNATLSSEKATESQSNWLLEESINVVPENANLSIK